MSTVRTASFLLTFAALGSLAAAAATRFIPAVLASAAVLALSAASWFPLARREARDARDRIAVLGEPVAVVLGMAAGGITRRAYVRGIGVAGDDEGDVAA